MVSKAAPKKSPRPKANPKIAADRKSKREQGKAYGKMDKALNDNAYGNARGLGTYRDMVDASSTGTRRGATTRKKMIKTAQTRKGK